MSDDPLNRPFLYLYTPYVYYPFPYVYCPQFSQWDETVTNQPKLEISENFSQWDKTVTNQPKVVVPEENSLRDKTVTNQPDRGITERLQNVTLEPPKEKIPKKQKRGQRIDIFDLEKTLEPPKTAKPPKCLNILDSAPPKNYPGKKSDRPRLTTLKKIIIRERSRDKEIPPEDPDSPLRKAKSKLHGDKFRDYCDHFTTIEIDGVVAEIVERLLFFQSRSLQRNAYKAKSRPRFTLGIKEVIKHLAAGRIRLLFLAPNVENIGDKGGLNECIENMLRMCREQEVPYAFCLSRQRLGRLISNRIPASIIGVFDYSGVEEAVGRLRGLVEESRRAYQEALGKVGRERSHCRTVSGGSAVSFSSSVMSKPLSTHLLEGGNRLSVGTPGQGHLRNGSNCSAISDIPDTQ